MKYELKRTKFLVPDSRIIDKTKGAKLTFGKVKKDKRNPLFKGDKPWEPNISNGYPNVIFDEQDKLYKCWYTPWIVDKAVVATPPEKRDTITYFQARDLQTRPRRDSGVCYAISRDGIHWEKPELGIAELNGSKKNNIVFSAQTISRFAKASRELPPSLDRGPHGAGIFKDLREQDPAKRFKMVFRDYSVSDPEEFYVSVAFSPDGLHWKDVSCPETDAAGDTHNNAFWVPELEQYVLITRLWSPDRVVGRCESRNFTKWTKSRVVLSNYRLGLKHQIYSMPVFRYGGIYIGLPAIYNGHTDRVHTELAWSPDTVKWYRINPGLPLIANAREMGAYDWGCVYTSYPVFLKNEIRIYYMGDPAYHNGWRDAGLCLATLRPDGFAGYEPAFDDTQAVITTRQITCIGKSLCISADVRGSGSVRVTLVDEQGKKLVGSKPLTSQPKKWEWEYETNTEITDGKVIWKNNLDFSSMIGKKIRLKFELNKAKLYSFSFND